MESHVLNMYRQTSFCGIGHTTPQSTSESPSSTSESPSSESSCNHSSPEYTMNTKASQYEEVEANTFWDHNNDNHNTWTNSQNANMTATNHDTSLENYSDRNYDCDLDIRVGGEEVIEYNEEENVFELSLSNLHKAAIICQVQKSMLVKGKHFDSLQVYIVDPDTLFSEEDDDESGKGKVTAPSVNNNEVKQENSIIEPDALAPTNNIPENTDEAKANNFNTPIVNEVVIPTVLAPTNNIHTNTDEVRANNFNTPIGNEVIIPTVLAPTNNIPTNTYEARANNFNTPIVTDVVIPNDILKPNDNNLLEIKQDPTVNDVDKYFIKESKISKRKKKSFDINDVGPVPNTLPLEIFSPDSSDTVQEEQMTEIEETENNVEVSTVNDDMDVFPNLEDIRHAFLGSPCKSRNAQKTHSVSLPQSPKHDFGLNLHAKASALTFEDVNLDILDISLELDKDKLNTSIKNADVRTLLTEEDVNSFLITDNNKQVSTQAIKNEDDLNLLDMDMDHPVDAIINFTDQNTDNQLTDRIRTSTPVPAHILEFCIEKAQEIKQEPEIKQESEDFVDVEFCPDTVTPVLEANNIDSLLEQFEATEIDSKAHIKLLDPEILTESKCSLTSGVQMQDNKLKMKKILMPPRGKPAMRRSSSPIHSDHDYCSPKKRVSLPAVKRSRSLLKPEVLSSNNRILNSRHRSCKNKKVVYCLSSDDEEENDKKKLKINDRHNSDDSDIKVNKKTAKCARTSIKPVNRKKQLSPHSVVNNSDLTKNNVSVIKEDASKATSDNSSSQKSNNVNPIKLVIKNKSKVFIKTCDSNDINIDNSCEKSKTSKSLSSSSSNVVSTEASDTVTSVEPLDRRKGSDKVSMDIVNKTVDPLNRCTYNKISTNETNPGRSAKSLEKVSLHINNTVKNVEPSHGSNSSNKESKHVKNFVKSVEPLDRVSTSSKVSPNAQNTNKIISSNKESSHVKNFVKPVETWESALIKASDVANSSKMIDSLDKSCSSKKVSRHDKKSHRNESSSSKRSSSKHQSTKEKNAVKVEPEEKSSNSKKESSNVNNTAKSVESEPLVRVKTEGDGAIQKNNSKNAQQSLTNNADKPVREQSKVKRKDEISKITLVDIPVINEAELPVVKKKLNLKEYRIRMNKGTISNNGSPQVSPESIFPETPNLNLDKNNKISKHVPSNVSVPKENLKTEDSKEVFDPILAASKKVLKSIQKQKDKASKRQDNLVIQKVENFVPQPLMSDAEMMKIVGMTPNVLPVPIEIPSPRDQATDYDELTLVSIGTSTDEGLLQPAEKQTINRKRKLESPQRENKSTINFRIKKTDTVLKQNVFDPVKNKKVHNEDSNRSDIKINKERFRDITETLKIVEKNVDTKISSNSLFASIQDIVKKKANSAGYSSNDHKSSKSDLPVEKPEIVYTKPTIVRQYDATAPHGEDKVILHLLKTRQKPACVSTCVQTEATDEFAALPKVSQPADAKPDSVPPRKRSDSDMSLSSDCSPVRPTKDQTVTQTKSEERVNVKSKTDTRHSAELSQSYERRSSSRSTRYDASYRRSNSQARNQRKRSRSRNRSRSREYKRHRRSDSPYRRRRRSRSRSPYRSTRRSPSVRRNYRSNNSRSQSKVVDQVKSRSPVAKKKLSPQYVASVEKVMPVSLTPPMRHPSVASSVVSSSSSSSSSASSASSKSSGSSSSYRQQEAYRAKSYRSSYSPEDRESNTPVEERRIVFVGRLEKDITKAKLRNQFLKFGPIAEVRLHSKEDGSRYGFVTYQRPRDAWTAVEAAGTFPQYDVGFGGRRAFCRQSYADLDGLEAKYSESAFHGQSTAQPLNRGGNLTFEQMLQDMKKTLNKWKGDKKSDDMSA